MKINDKFILKDGQPVPCNDLFQWAHWFEYADRHVGLSCIGDCEVSTVFLGLDHNWGSGPPILWETMVFGGTLDQEQDRCPGNIEQAEAMHQKWVKYTISVEFTWWSCFKRSYLDLWSTIENTTEYMKIMKTIKRWLRPYKPEYFRIKRMLKRQQERRIKERK